jgi:hypothetical protein
MKTTSDSSDAQVRWLFLVGTLMLNGVKKLLGLRPQLESISSDRKLKTNI